MFQINNEFANANISRTIRFTERLFKQLDALAVQNKLSFNQTVLQCCSYALQHLSDKK